MNMLHRLCQCTSSPTTMSGNTWRCVSCYQCAGACPLSLNIDTHVPTMTYMLLALCQCTSWQSAMIVNTFLCMSCWQRQCACTSPSLPHNATKQVVRVANAVPMHQVAIEDDWKYVPVHVLLPPPMRRHLPLVPQ